jgi:hypothetical protein
MLSSPTLILICTLLTDYIQISPRSYATTMLARVEVLQDAETMLVEFLFFISFRTDHFI